MNKLLLIIIISLSQQITFANCSSDSDKVVLFINTNATIHEIEAAERGSCARGEKLIVIPSHHKESSQINLEISKNSKT